MASRLFGRCVWLLPRVSSKGLTAAARQRTAGPRPGPGPAELLWATAWTRVPCRLLCESGRVAREEIISPKPARTQLDDLVEQATTPEEILRAWSELGGSANQAAITMVKLTRLVQGKKGSFTARDPDLITDPRLEDIMDTITKQVSSVWNGTLVSVLRSLWALSMPPTSAILRSIHTEVLWRVRRLTYRQLAFLVDWGVGRRGPQEVAIVSAALKQLELRWIEISDAKTVSVLMSKGAHVSPSLMDRLEDKALELAEGFSAEDIRKVFVTLASQSRRCVPLLRALSYHLLQKPSSDLTVPLLLDLAYAYGKLNFHHTQVFQRMAAELMPQVAELSPADVTRCAKSLGYLKWLNLPLFEAFAEHYTANSQKYSVVQLCNLLMTFARLGFYPSKTEEFYSKVHPALEGTLSGLDPHLHTDVVWSLCVLQQAKPHYLTPLIQPGHIAMLSEGSPGGMENYRLKLLHVAATLHLEHPGCSESVGSLSSLAMSPSAGAHSAVLSPLQRGLRDALYWLVGEKREALHTGIDTVYGWTIDGELVVDSENKPIDLLPLTAPHLSGKGGGAGGVGDQTLPVGTRRLAFLAWEFPNFGSRSKDLLGRFAMKKRHLQLAGFTVVEVPYYEWLELKSDRQKMAYLKDKVGKAVAEDMAK